MNYTPLIFLIVSAGFLAAAVVLFFRKKISVRIPLCFTLYMLSLTTMCAICYFCTEPLDTPDTRGKYFNSVMSAFAALGVQADYKDIVNRLTTLGELSEVYRLYSQLLFMTAPLVSGTVVVSIVSGFLPYLKFSLNKHLRGEVLVFSDLNKQSAEIYENMTEERRKKHSWLGHFAYCAVFVNIGETDKALIDRVEKMNGIVVNRSIDEISTQGIRAGKKTVRYYFVRDDDMRNVEDCLKVTSERNWNKWSKCRNAYMYIYAQSDEMPSVIKQICDIGAADGSNAESRKKRVDALKAKTHFAIIPYVTTTIYKTLSDHPLYDVLGEPSVHETLSVVISGTDIWAEEIFRAVYWCGQLPNKELRISCICGGEEDMERFRSRIYHLIPELDTYDSGPVYCHVEWYAEPVGTQGFDDLIRNNKEIRRAGVWFIVHGSDEENTEAASYVCARLRELNRLQPKDTVIHYIVRNSSIQKIFNEDLDQKQDSIKMHAFASLYDRHIAGSMENELYDIAYLLNDAWSDASEMATDSLSEYTRRSSLAQALYVKYRLYSEGLLVNSADWREPLKDYLYTLPADSASRNRRGYWEHRRWNAYMRSIGYRHIDVDEWLEYLSRGSDTKIFDKTKDIDKRLHTCIAEYPEELPAYGSVQSLMSDPEKLDEVLKSGSMDAVDKATYYSIIYGNRKNDIKSYDYSAYEACSEHYLILSELKDTLSKEIPGIYSMLNETIRKAEEYNELILTMSKRLNDRLKDTGYGYLASPEKFIEEHPYNQFCEGEIKNRTFKKLIEFIAETRTEPAAAAEMPVSCKQQKKENGGKTMYTPKPRDTSKVVLDEELLKLTELIAENVHEVYALGRIKEGWTYGPERDDAAKTNPTLVPYSELPESEKEYDRNTAMETIKLIISLGYRIEK